LKLKDDTSLLQRVVDILKGAEGKCPDDYSPGLLRINPDLISLIPDAVFSSEDSENVIIVRQATIDAFKAFKRVSRKGNFTFLLTGNPGIGWSARL
jgi:hypothetical protein